jgi:hypothetical protein
MIPKRIFLFDIIFGSISITMTAQKKRNEYIKKLPSFSFEKKIKSFKRRLCETIGEIYRIRANDLIGRSCILILESDFELSQVLEFLVSIFNNFFQKVDLKFTINQILFIHFLKKLSVSMKLKNQLKTVR